MISGGTSLSNPTTFTLELSFKTTTSSGGKLMGFRAPGVDVVPPRRPCMRTNGPSYKTR